MIEVEDNTENVININPPVVRNMTCYNSPRWLAHMAKTPTNTKQAEMNTWLLQIIYANPFVGLDHEDSYTHLTKFYDLANILGASEA